jgi:hypothetical protein
MRGALAAAALACLATAAPAAGKAEIKDACGPGAIGGPPAYVVEPPAPWLDVCDSDVTGLAGAGPLRAMRATLRLAGDAAMRPGFTQYTFHFGTAHCGASVSYIDADVGGSGGSTRVHGDCNPRTVPCPIVQSCSMSAGADSFDVTLPDGATRIAGSTVTLTLDPNGLVGHAVPRVLFADLSGGVLSSVEAITWARVGVSGQGRRATTADIADVAEGTKPVSLD